MTDIVLNLFIFFFISFSLLYTFNPERLAKVPVKPPTVTTPVASNSRSIRRTCGRPRTSMRTGVARGATIRAAPD